MRILNIFLMTFSLTALNALAESGGGGNGGNVRVCFPDSSFLRVINDNSNKIPNSIIKNITSVTPLDLFEARVNAGDDGDNNLNLPLENEDPDDYVVRMAERFQYIPGLTMILKNKLKLIKQDRIFYDAGIERIYDSKEAYYFDPERCVVATTVSQTSRSSDDVTLEIDKRLYNFNGPKSPSYVTQGVLMLHETVLRWALEQGHKDAKDARNLTAVLLQKNLPRSELVKKLLKFGFVHTMSWGPGDYVMSDSKTYTVFGGSISSESLVLKGLLDEMKEIVKPSYSFFSRELIKSSRLREDVGMDLFRNLRELFNKTRRPYCRGGSYQAEIQKLKNQINQLVQEIELLKKKLRRAIFRKQDLRRTIEEKSDLLQSYEKRLKEEVYQDDLWNECQINTDNYLENYKHEFEAGMIKLTAQLELTAKAAMEKIRDIKWMNEDIRQKAILSIKACQSGLLDDLELDESSCEVGEDFNHDVWNYDLMAP